MRGLKLGKMLRTSVATSAGLNRLSEGGTWSAVATIINKAISRWFPILTLSCWTASMTTHLRKPLLPFIARAWRWLAALCLLLSALQPS